MTWEAQRCKKNENLNEDAYMENYAKVVAGTTKNIHSY